jgi:hypothetical protein
LYRYIVLIYKEIEIMKTIKYEKIEKFSKKAGISTRTVYRFYNKNSDLHGETKKQGVKRLYPLEHLKYFNRETMFEENKIFRASERMMKNLIDCLYEDNNPLAIKLWRKEWSMFISVDYKHERGKTYCFTKMHELYELLESKYGDKTIIRMFFVTEPFANRNNGQHNHIVFYVEDTKFKHLIMADVKLFFKYDRVDYKDYDRYKAGVFYMAKEGFSGEDWDILGNYLSGETIHDEV